MDCVAPSCSYVGEPAGAPDGRRIAFERVLVASDGTTGVPSLQIVDVTTGRSFEAARFRADLTAYTPSWSPDGRALLYELDRFASTRADEGRVLDHRLQTVDLGSGRRTTLTDRAKDAQGPDWNPRDGRIVYFQPLDRERGFLVPLDLVIIDRSGRHFATRVRLRGERALQPSWTPDGRSVVFVFVFERELYDSTVAFLDPASGRITKTTTVGTRPRVRP